MRSKEYMEARGPLVKQMQDLTELAAKENRSLTDEERDKFNKLDADQKELKQRADDAYHVETLVDEQEQPVERAESVPPKPQREDRVIDQDAAFRGWILGARASAEQQEQAHRAGYIGNTLDLKWDRRGRRPPKSLHEAQQRLDALLDRSPEERAQSTTTTAGGYTIPDEMMAAIDVALRAWGGMRQVATVLETETGADLPIPLADETGATGEIPGENTTATEDDIAFTQKVLSSFSYSSKYLKASHEFLEDTSINAAAFIGDVMGTRIGRKQNSDFTVGAGTTLPFGVVVGAYDSNVTAAAADALTYSEVLQLKHSVDPAYRGPRSGFMANDTTLRIMKEMADAQGRPLWQPNLVAGAPDTFDGSPFYVNQDVTDGTGEKALLYGDFTKYYIRDVRSGFRLIRMDETFALLNQVAWVGWMRSDGVLAAANTTTYNPVKYLTMG